MRAKAKVLDRLARVLGATEEQCVGASGRAHGELVKCQAFSTSRGDACAGCCSETESGDCELGNLEQAVVIGDGGYDDDGLVLVLLGCVLVRSGCDNFGKGKWRSVDLAHHQSSQDDLVEVGIRSSSEESVEFDEQGEVWIRRLLCLSVARPDVVLVCELSATVLK